MTNPVIMQYFEWYLPDDGQHWNRLKEDAQHLKDLGINQVWMPPAFKATGTNDVGYGVYDIYDLGQFDQNGSVRTKYGTKDEYLAAIDALKEQGIKPIADIVLNHKANGDEKEAFMVLKMDPNNRQKPLSEPYEIEAWTHFYFPGRNKTYSDFEWHWYHFTGTDYDARNDETGIYLILGDNKGWANGDLVDTENGNFDYLMFTDIDFRHPEVKEHLYQWAHWFIQETGIQGFRLDAIKHIDADFMKNFIEYIHDNTDEEFFIFGEYWNPDVNAKEVYLAQTDYEIDLVDVGLHMNFHVASKNGNHYDLSTILDDTLMEKNPFEAVTFVENHDTQKGQALQSYVEDWFKPAAYAMILLMQNGQPCVFYGDYYGVNHDQFGQPKLQWILDKLLYLRKEYAYGEENRYFDHPNCIGWTRLGTEDHPNALAVVISNGDEGWKNMNVGTLNAGKVFIDYLGHHDAQITIDENGNADFPVRAGSVSCWVEK